MTNLVQILSEKENYIIYYDRDVFNQDVTLSIHLTVPNLANQTGHVTFDSSSVEQWNTIYEEEFGTSGNANGIKNITQAILFTPVYNVLNFQNDFAFVNSASYIPDTIGNFNVTIDSANYNVIITSPDAFKAVKNVSQLVNTNIVYSLLTFNTEVDINNNFNLSLNKYTVPYNCIINFKASFNLTSNLNILTTSIRFFSTIKGEISIINIDYLQNLNRSVYLETSSLLFSQNEEVWIEIRTTNVNNIVSFVTVNSATVENAIGPFDNGTLYLSGQDIKYYRTVSGVPQFIEQSLQEIAIQIWAIPTFATITGEVLATISPDILNYTLPLDYDLSNNYTYKWRLRKINNLTDTDIFNSRATIVGSNTGKNVNVTFTRNGFVNLECIITGPTGCPRIVRKQISVELPLTKMLIIRNRLL